MAGAFRLLHGLHALLITARAAAEVDPLAWEPTDVEYWGPVSGDEDSESGGRHEVPEFSASTLSRPEFDKLVRRGGPFVVRGVGASHPMRAWSCDFFRQDPIFSKVEAREEYGSSGPIWMRLGVLAGNGSSRCVPDEVSGKRASPFYLGIKDAAHSDEEQRSQDPFFSPTWTEAVLAKVRDHTVLPSFMDPRNERYLRDTPELWFSSGGCGGGAKAHVDQHRESTMSLQLAGRKRWRVSFIAPRAAPHVMRLYADGQIYNREESKRWNIMRDAFLEEGDAIFFGPGFIHQTDAAAECTASVTWQFDAPYPTTLWRRFLPRIRWTPDLESTWDLLRELLDRQGGKAEDALFDIDDDGQVSDEERRRVAGVWHELEARARQDIPGRLRREGFGTSSIVSDQEELRNFPPDIRKAVRKWEKHALAQDEALALKAASQREPPPGGGAAMAGGEL